MASNSGWTTGLPSGTSRVSNTDEEFRSVKSFVEAWLEAEHYVTSGSANSAGISKHGAGRAFVGTTSQLSNPTADNDGRFLHATDTGQMFVANASTSSWSIFADNIDLVSQQTWTATQEFSDLLITGSVSGITSFSSTLATALKVNALAIGGQVFDNSIFTYGDFIFPSVDTFLLTSGNVANFQLSAHIASLATLISLTVETGASGVTFPVGTVVRFLGFKPD